MADDRAEINAQIATARLRLRSSLREARTELEALRKRPLLEPREKEELTAIAERGEMGKELREFAREVKRGSADWESFVRRTDGRADLFQDLVHRSEVRFGDDVKATLESSEAPPDVEDPRAGR